MNHFLNEHDIQEVNHLEDEVKSILSKYLTCKENIDKNATGSAIVPEIEPQKSTSPRIKNSELPEPSVALRLTEMRKLLLNEKREVSSV